MRPRSSLTDLVPFSVGDPGSLDDGVVVPHVVDESYKTIIKHREGVAEDLVKLRDLDSFEALCSFTHVEPPGSVPENLATLLMDSLSSSAK